MLKSSQGSSLCWMHACATTATQHVARDTESSRGIPGMAEPATQWQCHWLPLRAPARTLAAPRRTCRDLILPLAEGCNRAHVGDAVGVIEVVVERNDDPNAEARRLGQNVVDAAEHSLVKDTCGMGVLMYCPDEVWGRAPTAAVPQPQASFDML